MTGRLESLFCIKLKTGHSLELPFSPNTPIYADTVHSYPFCPPVRNSNRKPNSKIEALFLESYGLKPQDLLEQMDMEEIGKREFPISRVMELYEEDGIELTVEQAEQILLLSRKLVNIVVTQYRTEFDSAEPTTKPQEVL